MPTLHWIGKEAVENHDKEIPFKLIKCEEIFGSPDSGNLIVQGDNLEALKALLPYYAGQVKCIYIDPPYNTGNEGWAYNDNVNSPEMKEWLFKVVEKDDLTRHDKWLCMMFPRLKLLYQFLKGDGVLLISIDDNEVSNLLLLLDEIFGPNNFIALLPTIMNLKGNQDQYGFAGTHEYTIAYAKNKNDSIKKKIDLINKFDLDDDEMDKWDVDDINYFKKGAPLRATGAESNRTDRPKMFYPILYNSTSGNIETICDEEYLMIYNTEDKTFNDDYLKELKAKYELLEYKFVLPKDENGNFSRWRWGWKEETKRKLKTEVLVVSNEDSDTITFYKKQRPELGDLPSKKPKTLFYKPEYSSGNGTSQISKIFGNKIFDNPKPIELIKDLILLSTSENDIILDSFAGSGTTAHSILEINKEQNSNRKFILIEMDKNICNNVTTKRVVKAINGYTYKKKNGADESINGLGGSFNFCKLDKPLFDEKGNISLEVKFIDLARHVFFSETGTPLSSKIEIGNSPFLSIFKDTAYYLLFNGILGDKSINGGNILTTRILTDLTKYKGKKVIFGEGCRISVQKLRKENIIFKQVPYEIKVK